MKFICEDRGGKVYVRGKCCMDRTDSPNEFRENYSSWIIEDLDISNPNVLADEDGRLLYGVVDGKAIREPSALTPKEQAAKDKPTLEQAIERIAILEELANGRKT